MFAKTFSISALIIVIANMPLKKLRLPAAAFCLSVVLGSCSFYHAEPLDKQTGFTASPADIAINAKKLPLASLKAYHFPANGSLDETGIAILAVLNNPDLKLARADARISYAQAFSSGLLPDPMLGVADDLPMTSGAQIAYGLNASYDIGAFIKEHSAIAAAKADNRKTDLTLLWQELQTISQARQLFNKTIAQDKALAILSEYQAFLARSRDEVVKAVESHQLTHDGASAVLAAYDDFTTKRNDAARQAAKNHEDLNAFLGLDSRAMLSLTDNRIIVAATDKDIPQLLKTLPQRRPDLLALEYGYHAEDERYYQAILDQFPAINAGYSRAKDNTGINSQGFIFAISLPVFNRNQGVVAVEKATRSRLHEEYYIRINKAEEEVDGVLAGRAITRKQYEESLASLAQSQKTQADNDGSYRRHQIDLTTYTNLQGAYVTKRLDVIALQEVLAEQRIAIDTLLAKELPAGQ